MESSQNSEIDLFLDALTRELDFLPSAQVLAIRDELAAHLYEMMAQRDWEGLPPDRAWQEAKAAFGDPKIHAKALRTEWRTWQRHQWSRRLFQRCNERKLAMAGAGTIGVTPQEVHAFTRAFSTMVNEGKALVPILDTLATQESNPELKRAIEDISAEIVKGRRLSNAMVKYPRIFIPQYITVIQQGEVAGILEHSLTLLAEATPARDSDDGAEEQLVYMTDTGNFKMKG